MDDETEPSESLQQKYLTVLEQLREQIGDAYDQGDVRLATLSKWIAEIDLALATEGKANG